MRTLLPRPASGGAASGCALASRSEPLSTAPEAAPLEPEALPLAKTDPAEPTDPLEPTLASSGLPVDAGASPELAAPVDAPASSAAAPVESLCAPAVALARPPAPCPPGVEAQPTAPTTHARYGNKPGNRIETSILRISAR